MCRRGGDVDARLDWAGCGELRPEVGDGLTADGILLIVYGDDHLCGMAEMLGRGIPGEDKVPDEEHEVCEGPELDCLAVAGAICVFAGPKAEVEANCGQVGDVVGSGVRGSGYRDNDGVNDSQRGGLLSSYGGILEPVDIELLCGALVNPGMRLRVRWFSGVGQTIHEVGPCNQPPCPRNRFFPKSAHPELGVLGVLNTVAVDLEDCNARDGYIVDIRIEQQGSTEVVPLPVQPLLSHILSYDVLHGFLCSANIMHESSSGDRRDI